MCTVGRNAPSPSKCALNMYHPAPPLVAHVQLESPSFLCPYISYLLPSRSRHPIALHRLPAMLVVPVSHTRWMYWAVPVVALRPPLKPVNDVPLARDLLMGILSDLYECLYRSFWRQICLVVHGSGVMVLHLTFQHRRYIQDIADTHRSLVREYVTLSFRDAEQRFLTCIEMTACHFEVTIRCRFASPMSSPK